MTTPKLLSPAAQAVMDAAYALPLKNGQPSIGAALRAAAPMMQFAQDREKLLDIAAELEGSNA